MYNPPYTTRNNNIRHLDDVKKINKNHHLTHLSLLQGGDILFTTYFNVTTPTTKKNYKQEKAYKQTHTH